MFPTEALSSSSLSPMTTFTPLPEFFPQLFLIFLNWIPPSRMQPGGWDWMLSRAEIFSSVLFAALYSVYTHVKLFITDEW